MPIISMASSMVLRPSQLWSVFERDITMITPYVEFEQINQLKSDWVCMRQKEDYLEIYEIINAVKEDNSLPK